MEKINFKKEQIPFTQVANQVLNDPSLSFKAKGIYAYLYSKPEGWDFAIERIAKDSTEGERAVRSGIHELEEQGYLYRERQPSGRVVYLLKNKMQTIAPLLKQQEGEKPPLQNAPLPKTQGAVSAGVSNKEVKEIKSSSKKELTPKFSPEVYGMVDLLTGLIKRNNPDWQMRGTVETWASHIDKLHRIDGRTFEQIAYMIKWTQHDQFWSQNILSTEKLREKFNDLIPKLKASAVKLQNERVASAKPKML